MLTKEGCLARRRRLWAAVPDEVEWLLVADPRHVLYLSNFWVQPLSFSAGERGLLLLERDSGATLFGDNFTLRSAASEPHVDREVVEKWYDHKHSVENRDHALVAALATVADRLEGCPGAIESEWLPVDAWHALGLDCDISTASVTEGDESDGDLDLGTVLRHLRRQKEPDEIALLKLCMKATDAGHLRAREIVRPGMSELDVYREVQSAAIEAAGQAAILYGDFRATNAAAPKAGGLPTTYRLREGDLFILDYSVVIDGYRSDFTNALAVGTPSDAQRRIFQTCEAGMRAGEAVLQAGVKARDVYAAVSRPLEDAGYGALSHHAGHGIGLAHPEPPILVPDSDDVLMDGDVLTLEPGLYVEGVGGVRIEHNYLIRPDGYERLSDHVISLT